MPPGNAVVTFVLVIRLLVSRLRLPAVLAAIQRRENESIREANNSERFSLRIREDRAGLRIAAAEPMHFKPFRQLPDYRNGGASLRVLGSVSRPFQIERVTCISSLA